MNSIPLVVTGAKGYVGQRLVNQLVESGKQVIEVDVLGPRGLDLSDPDAAEKLSGWLPGSFDLIHLAFPFPGTMRSKDMEGIVEKINFSLLSLSPRPLRTLFISSTAVYSPDNLMEHSPWEIYGHLKSESEIKLQELGNLSVLRPGTLIDASRRSVMATIYLRALSGQLAILPRHGSLAHPFLHVDDLVGACLWWSEQDDRVNFVHDLWASEPTSAQEYLQTRGAKSRILNLPGFIQRSFGSDSIPFFGITKWHLKALSYDVSGRESGYFETKPPRKMSDIFDELLFGTP
jgi:nucleoside-diphosphate-sugar epimerase